MSVYLAEFVGTMILILFGSGANAGATLKGSYAKDSGWLTIAFGWGLAVTMAIYAVGEVSGAHINPAVTLALAFSGDFEWQLVPGYCLAQVLGGAAGATIVWLHYLPHWRATDDPAAKLGIFSTGPAIPSLPSNVTSEVIGTAVLVLGLLFIGANQFTDGLNPMVVGLLIVIIGISLGGTTGYAINPARDLGPRIAHAVLPIAGKGSSNWRYAWVPIVAPLLGGVLGAAAYRFLFDELQ